MILARPVVLALTVTASLPSLALAQVRESDPIARFAADIRAVLPRYPTDTATQDALGVTKENMPERGLGVSFGAHVYPLRLGRHVALGLGAELIRTSGSKTLEPTTEGGTVGPTVKTRFSAFTPQVSLNFGTRNGWSYVSAGLGRASFTTELDNDPVAEATSNPRVLNYGGGARWFAKEHLAFTFDIRFHRIDPQEAIAGTTTINGRPAYARRRLFLASAGMSFK
jgi:hypothetical protein